MAEKAAELLVTQKLLDQILKAPGNLIALETTHVNDALVQFRTLAMRTGTSMYLWEPDGGISSLRESGLRVPGSKRITDALRYVLPLGSVSTAHVLFPDPWPKRHHQPRRLIQDGFMEALHGILATGGDLVRI